MAFYEISEAGALVKQVRQRARVKREEKHFSFFLFGKDDRAKQITFHQNVNETLSARA